MQRGAQWIEFRSDSRGFNNPHEIWQSTRLIIAALGDSFTQGYCGPTDKNFVALIRRYQTATLNLGIAGDGPLLMLAKLKEYLSLVHPKIVLWCYYAGNDLANLQTERRSALLRNYLKDEFSQPHLARQSDIDRGIIAEIPLLTGLQRKTVERDADRRTSNRALYRFLAFAKLTALRDRLGPFGKTETRATEMAADSDNDNMNVFREILHQAKARVDGWNGQLYFVYLPDWARYSGHRSLATTKRNEVLTLVHDLGIPIIDIDPVFQGHGDPLSLFPFRGNGHHTETGHRLVAEAVLRRLASTTPQ